MKSWPSGVCVKCKFVFWSRADATYYVPKACEHEWKLFTREDGTPIGCLSVAAFNKHAYWNGKKVKVKDVKKLDHPVFGWRGEM